MKKYALGLWLVVASLFSFAPFAMADSGLDINQVLANSIVGILVIVVPALAALLVKLLVNQIKKSNTQVDDRLAAIAVAWVEDQMADQKGEAKLDAAAKKLSELSKGKISPEQARVLAAATFQKMKTELNVLKN